MASHENNRRHSLRHVSKCIIKQTPSAFPESAERKRTQTRRQIDSRSKVVGMGTQHHQRVHFIVRREEEDLELQKKARGEPQARALWGQIGTRQIQESPRRKRTVDAYSYGVLNQHQTLRRATIQHSQELVGFVVDDGGTRNALQKPEVILTASNGNRVVLPFSSEREEYKTFLYKSKWSQKALLLHWQRDFQMHINYWLSINQFTFLPYAITTSFLSPHPHS